MKPTTVKLTGYNGSPIPVRGKCILRIKHKSKKETPVLFIDIESTPILGHKCSSGLNLIQRIHEVKESIDVPDYVINYKDCFGNLGCLQTVHHIAVNESIKPVIHPPRKIPYAMLDRLKDELDG